jgi:uncharacterized iron-regulated protein
MRFCNVDAGFGLRGLIASLGVVGAAACGARAEEAVGEGLAAAAPRAAPSMRERRAGRLLDMAREVLPPAGRPELPGVPPPSSMALDAALPEELADAGVPSEAPTSLVPHPVPEGDAGALAPPEALPADVVARAALPIFGLEAGVVLTESELFDRLAASPAVCLGEFHDVAAHHYAQARALDELAARAEAEGLAFGVGFEMFQRPFQTPLSAYAAGELSEAEMLEQTEYATRWGLDFALYRPLLEGAQAHGLAALALNAPAELTREIGRNGLEALDAAQLAQVPELVLDDAEHRAFIFGLFGVLPEQAAEAGLENVYVAQTTWDETMAETSASWLLEEGPAGRLLIFAGGAHCHRSAIPRRITRRTNEPALSAHAVFASDLESGAFTPEGYDVLVVLDDRAAAPDAGTTQP